MAVNEHDGYEEDARLARLYKEAAREEPPAHLDRALRAAAREGAGRPAPARTTSSWWAPWRLPFAFAALAVVSVSLVTLMIEEDRERVTSVPVSPPPRVYEREEAKIAQQPAEAPASIQGPRDAERSPRAQRQDARKLEPEFAPEPPSTTSPRREAPRAEAPAAAPEAGPRTLQKAPASAAEPSPVLGALGASAPRGTSSEVQAPRTEDRAAAAAAPEQAERPPAKPAPPPPAAGAPAAERAPAPAAKPAPAVRGLQREDYGMLARPSPEVARHIVDLESKPPAAWIERVLSLRREGRTAEADGLLAEFRRRFPGEPLPTELQ